MRGLAFRVCHVCWPSVTHIFAPSFSRAPAQHGVFELKVGYTYLGKRHSTWITARQPESVAATLLHMRPLRRKTPHMNATIIQRVFRCAT